MNTGKTGIPSRILDSLNLAIQNEFDVHQRRLLICKRACAYARFSFIELARSDVAVLRQENKDYNPRLAAWIIFLESLIFHFEGLDSSQSLGRLKRAHAIAVAINDEELIHTCLAWLAATSFILGNISSALDQLRQLFRHEKPIESDALSRAYLVIADILSWSGDIEHAKSWYRDARAEAIKSGDLSTQSSVLFNSASFQISELTVRQCLGMSPEKSIIKFAALEVNSVVNLEKGIGQPYLLHLVKLLQADTLVLEEKFQEAQEIYYHPSLSIDDISPRWLAPRIMAQRAWSNFQLGNFDRAHDECLRSMEMVEECTDLDDLVVLYSRASVILGEKGGDASMKSAISALENCKVALIDMRSQMRREIENVLQVVKSHKEKTRP